MVVGGLGQEWFLQGGREGAVESVEIGLMGYLGLQCMGDCWRRG